MNDDNSDLNDKTNPNDPNDLTGLAAYVHCESTTEPTSITFHYPGGDNIVDWPEASSSTITSTTQNFGELVLPDSFGPYVSDPIDDALGSAYLPFSHTKPSYTFDDVLLLPQLGNISSRSECDPGSTLGGHGFRVPLMNAPMDCICSPLQSVHIFQSGGLPVVDRFSTSPDDLYDHIRYYIRHITRGLIRTVIQPLVAPIVVALGTDPNDYKPRIDKALQAYIDAAIDKGYHNLDSHSLFWLIDIANGYSTAMEGPISYIEERTNPHGVFRNNIIGGNVCTYEGAKHLADMGCNIIRVGVGCGSMCTTRLQTGVGRGQLSAIWDTCELKAEEGYEHIEIIADGGIKHSGDIVKALAAGAYMCMSGRMFAGTVECPEWARVGDKYIYRGQASKQFMDDNHVAGKSIEGDSTLVHAQESVNLMMRQVKHNLQSGMSYLGARRLQDLHENAAFEPVSQATYMEGKPKH